MQQYPITTSTVAVERRSARVVLTGSRSVELVLPSLLAPLAVGLPPSATESLGERRSLTRTTQFNYRGCIATVLARSPSSSDRAIARTCFAPSWAVPSTKLLSQLAIARPPRAALIIITRCTLHSPPSPLWRSHDHCCKRAVVYSFGATKTIGCVDRQAKTVAELHRAFVPASAKAYTTTLDTHDWRLPIRRLPMRAARL